MGSQFIKRNIQGRFMSLVLGIVVFCTYLFTALAASATDYTYIELLPQGYVQANATGVNDSGAVVGWAYDGTTARGFLYTGSGYETLLPDGYFQMLVEGINNNGTVVGSTSEVPNQFKGVIYHNVTYTTLLPPGGVEAVAYCVNDNEAVVGTMTYSGSSGGNLKGFRYLNGNYTEIRPGGWSSARAFSINNSGDIVGDGNTVQGQKGFLYNSEGIYTVIAPPGWLSASARTINNSGSIAGSGVTNQGLRGFLYNGMTYTELLPSGFTRSYATGINDRGDVILNAGIDDEKGFLYRQGNYTEIIPPGWSQSKLYDINNNGVIVGYGLDANGVEKGFIAIPPLASGDINGDGTVNLADAILSLKVVSRSGISGVNQTETLGIGRDGKLGLEETIYILQKAAGIR